MASERRYTGKTMEEALEEASFDMGISRVQMKVKVVQQEKKGFLGMGSQPAIIEVSAVELDKAETVADAFLEKEPEPGEIGRAAFQDGRVLVVDAKDGVSFPTITAEPHLTVTINGEELKGTQEVSSKDIIEVTGENVAPSLNFNCRLSDDKMNAYVMVQAASGGIFQVEETPFRNNLVLAAQFKETEDAPPVSLEQLVDFLQGRGVVFGVDEEALSYALQGNNEVLVAQGVPPIPGQDAFFRKLFVKEDEKEFHGLNTYRKVISVETGDLLVEKVPANPGQPGINVLGQIVDPEPVKDVVLKAGKGAVMEGTGKVTATLAGRPEIKGSMVSVYPAYTINGDADPKNGHIKFKGDVLIYGDVLDGMRIEATGRIEISGYAANANLLAGEELIVRKNLISCIARVGGNQVACGRIAGILGQGCEKLQQFETALGQLKENQNFHKGQNNSGMVIKLLLENKFSDLPKAMAQNLQEYFQQKNLLNLNLLEIEDGLLDFLELRLKEFLAKITGWGPKEVSSIEDLYGQTTFLREHLANASDIMKAQSQNQAHATLGYLNGSRVEVSGLVKVIGRGSHNSRIFAAGDVVFSGSPGVFCGGEIISGGDIRIKVLGNESETHTMVQVPRGGAVRAEVVYPGVTIKTGSYVEKINLLTHNLEMKM